MELEKTQRRRARRRPGVWHGRYRLGRLRTWTECRVLDVSMGGAAIEMAPHVDVRGPLTLELRPVGTALEPVTLQARVRHARRRRNGDWHVGLEFADLRPTERDALDRMLRLFAT